MDEDIAETVIRRKLLEHRLPREWASHLWNASGQERVCDGCDEKIELHDKAVWGIAVRDWGSYTFTLPVTSFGKRSD